MIAQYVLKSFSRHKARTIIVVLALLVVTAMLVALNNGVESLQQQVVEIVEQMEGEHDVTITRAETSPSQYIDVERVSAILREADPDGIPVPFLAPAFTDARLFADLGIQTYGFTPMKLAKDFPFAGLIHGADERIPVDALIFGANAM